MAHRFAMIVVVGLIGLGLPGHALGAGPDDFVRLTGAKTLSSLGPELSSKDRAQQFRAILKEAFDLATIARFAMGRYWRTASKEQRHEYVMLFEDFVVQAYANRFKGLGATKFRITKTRKLSGRDTLVTTEIVHQVTKPPVRLSWRVRGSEQSFKVIDVIVEGVSMLVTQRDEFAAVIRSSGGKIDGLLAALRRKTGRSK